jgi:SAM-dependent methyltransferase
MEQKSSPDNTRLETVDRCDGCGSSHSADFLEVSDRLQPDDRYQLVKCQECGLIYLDPRPRAAFLGEHYGEEYYVFPGEADAGLVPEGGRARKLYNWAERTLLGGAYNYPHLLPSGRSMPSVFIKGINILFRAAGRDTNLIPYVPNGRLLDVGSGNGHNLERFRRLGWEVAGVEPSSFAAARVVKRGFDVFNGDLLAAGFEDGAFDVAYFNQTLEHMPSPRAILRETHRILKPGGLVCIRVPNAGSMESRWFGGYWSPWEAPRHLYHFDRSAISDMLQRSGFRVLKVKGDFIPANFVLNLQFWQERTGKCLWLSPAISRLISFPLVYACGYAGKGNGLVVFAVKEGS